MSHTLVLNKQWSAICIVDWKKSISLLYQNHANVIDSDCMAYDFQEWNEISKERIAKGVQGNVKSSVSFTIFVPEVISLLVYDRLPPQDVILTRESIFVRDGYRCGFCGKQFKRKDLTWDHIIPRSQGGKNTWENLISACGNCNSKKSNLSLKDAGMKLLWTPTKPKWTGKMGITLGSIKVKKSWESWISKAYWNIALDPD